MELFFGLDYSFLLHELLIIGTKFWKARTTEDRMIVYHKLQPREFDLACIMTYHDL